MKVLIDNRHDSLKISQKKIREAARAILDALGFPEGELSILILDDSQIAVLNKTYLNRIGPTNVIAFPMHSEAFPDIAPELLGDVVISAETAEKEGFVSGIGTEARLKELLVHGILHLVGFDHENDIKAARRMQKKSRELLDIIEKRAFGRTI